MPPIVPAAMTMMPLSWLVKELMPQVVDWVPTRFQLPYHLLLLASLPPPLQAPRNRTGKEMRSSRFAFIVASREPPPRTVGGASSMHGIGWCRGSLDPQ